MVGSESWRKTKGLGRGLVAETERMAEPFWKLLVGGRLKSAGVGGPKWTETAVGGLSRSLDRVTSAGVGSVGVKVARRGDEGWLFPSPRRDRVIGDNDRGASSSSTICILEDPCVGSSVECLSAYYGSTSCRLYKLLTRLVEIVLRTLKGEELATGRRR